MRKKVLIFGHNYETHFIDIYNQYTKVFDPSQYDITVAFLTGARDEEVKNRLLASQCVFLNFSKKSIRSLKILPLLKLLALTRQHQFDIVICHRYKPTYIMLLVALFYKFRAMIFVMHEFNTMRSLPRRLLIKLLSRNNMLFAGVSNAVRDDLRKALAFLPKNQVITLYNMIDIELMQPQLLSANEARQALNLSKDTFVFGNLARLVKNKDHVTLLSAFKLIQPHCPQAKLIILGTGELEASLKSLTKELQLENHVIFTGFIAKGFSYMRAFDCFVLSSTQEAFGRVLIEAMVAEVPIIATRVHGIPEVLGSTNTLIETRNIQQLAAAMQTCYTANPAERKKISEAGYTHVTENYSVTKFKEQFWELELLK